MMALHSIHLCEYNQAKAQTHPQTLEIGLKQFIFWEKDQYLVQGPGSDAGSERSSQRSFGSASRSVAADLAGIAAAGIARLRNIASGARLD